jgi:hypothetical protein
MVSLEFDLIARHWCNAPSVSATLYQCTVDAREDDIAQSSNIVSINTLCLPKTASFKPPFGPGSSLVLRESGGKALSHLGNK